VKSLVTVSALVLLLLAGSCGGGDDGGGLSEDEIEIANALGLRIETRRAKPIAIATKLYALPSGQDCIVTKVLRSSDEVKSAQDEAGAIDSAVATNSAGDGGVEFGGRGVLGSYTGFSPDECVGPAEADLNTLSAG
jgi:hypothetical protein